MSGLTGSSDIEDVVSSVRRLVSVDGRTRPVTRDLGADRLLLTPALQIVPEPAPDLPLDPAPMIDAAPEDATATATPLPEPEDEPPLVAAAPADPPAPDLPPLADVPAPVAGPEVSPPVLEEASVAVPPEAEAVAQDEIPTADLATPEAEPEALVAVVEDAAFDLPPTALLLADVAEASPPPEPHLPPAPLHLVEEEWEDEIWAEDDPPLAELALGAEEAEVILPDLAPQAATPPRRPPLDPDAAWAQVEGDWADDLPDPVVPFAPHRARTLAQAPQPPADAPRGDAVELTDTDGNPLTILDEAALQEIVRQMIREELQGGLGERITRNVRKLVRAEINRALTARALD